MSELTGELESKDQDKNGGNIAGKIDMLMCLRYIIKVSHIIRTRFHPRLMTFVNHTQNRLHQRCTLMQGMKETLNKVSNQQILPLLSHVSNMTHTTHFK